MFVKRVKFVCQLFPNMRVGDSIQFVGGEFVANTAKQIETLRNMKSVVREVEEKEPEKVVETPKEISPDVAMAELEEFKVPARWDKKRIKAEARKRGIQLPSDDLKEMLKEDMITFLEDAVNTGAKE